MAINSVKKLIKALLYPWYEKRLLRKLDFNQTPHHIGIIVDGNRRWAKANTVATKSGHQAGANKINEFLNWCEDAQVKIVTVWLLSTDNFKRSQEELDELKQAIGDQDPVETLDALLDIMVVTAGAIHSMGADAEGAWKEVMKTNFAKVMEDGKVRKREDGKVLKPVGWTPPNLSPFTSKDIK